MKKLIFIFLVLLPTLSFSQQVITDANFEKAIEGRSAFQDDNIQIVVIEFWASFNDENSFKGWNKLEGVKYYKCDIAKSPKAKKKYKVRTIPHIVIFKEGYAEVHIKAGLDFTISESLEEIQLEIEELKKESKFQYMAMPCPNCKQPLGLTLEFIIKHPVMQCPHCTTVLNFSGNTESAKEYLQGFKELQKLRDKYSKIATFS